MKDGGPAFPGRWLTSIKWAVGENCVKDTHTYEQVPGMSLRDYFAAAALTGLLASPAPMDETDVIASKTLALSAYIMADAMLAAREKEKP